MATKKTASARTSPVRSAARASAAPLAAKRITARDLRGFRHRLEEELKALRGRYDGLEAATASSLAATRERGLGEEPGDLGSYAVERDQDATLVGNLRDLIEKIEGALARMDDGSYGRCEVCGQQIEAERLDALPYTTLCLRDARRRSRAR